jgi:branched-chain amino acid transport system ATP-binding protein
MLLEARNIRVRYGRMIAVSDVSLAVPRGSLVALLGSNGAGKTTTLRAISGLARVDQGTIAFDGARIANLAPHAIARLGIAHVPEGRGLLATITVEENLRIGAMGRRDVVPLGKARAEIFDYFPQLRTRIRERAGVLSGGEQQMLSIARALLKSPQLLMIDEMSLGLAPKVVDQLMQVTVALAASGLAVLCVEQNTKKVLRHASYAYVLETGRTVIEGKGADLLGDERVIHAYLGKGAVPAQPAAAKG